MKKLPGLSVLLLALAWSPSNDAQERVGAFRLYEVRDEASGELRQSIHTDPLRASLSPTADVDLIWICASGNLRVLYTFGTALRGDGTGAVEVRFKADDDAPFIEQQWWVSSGGRRLVMALGDEPDLNAIASLEGTLITEVRDPSDGRQFSHRFLLTRFKRALEHLPCAER
ncbi:MAG: hypothetical protein LC632_06595 [Xanthomonadaceae bacterium]|nr:hypothetical protein [Xanthomonadaceae bacterium]